jgi:hypothetical protein
MTNSLDDVEPEKDLLAQITAQKLVLNALLITLIEKKLVEKHDVVTLLESTVSSLDQHAHPFNELISSYVREFHVGIGE